MIRGVFFATAVAALASVATPPPPQPVVVMRVREIPPMYYQCTALSIREHKTACALRAKSL